MSLVYSQSVLGESRKKNVFCAISNHFLTCVLESNHDVVLEKIFLRISDHRCYFLKKFRKILLAFTFVLKNKTEFAKELTKTNIKEMHAINWSVDFSLRFN